MFTCSLAIIRFLGASQVRFNLHASKPAILCERLKLHSSHSTPYRHSMEVHSHVIFLYRKN